MVAASWNTKTSTPNAGASLSAREATSLDSGIGTSPPPRYFYAFHRPIALLRNAVGQRPQPPTELPFDFSESHCVLNEPSEGVDSMTADWAVIEEPLPLLVSRSRSLVTCAGCFA